MSIHTIGDSHSGPGSGWTGIIQHHFGPVLC